MRTTRALSAHVIRLRVNNVERARCNVRRSNKDSDTVKKVYHHWELGIRKTIQELESSRHIEPR